jgi:para-nitrobenzyl esterase
MYELDWRSPAFGGELGACHGLDLGFVFDTLASVRGPEGLAGPNPPQAIADHVHGIWVRFATDGRLPWDEFTRETRQVYQLARGTTLSEPAMPAARHLP